MVTVDLAEPTPDELVFLIERARAIKASAHVEQGMSALLAVLLNTSFELAGIVFFRIANTNSRNTIIESLLEKRYGTTYQGYWSGIPNTKHKGLFTLIRQLDQCRNSIVHWHTLRTMHIEGENYTSTFALVRPSIWNMQDEAQSVTAEDMSAFTLKANFVSRSINTFAIYIGGSLSSSPDFENTWRDIFQLPALSASRYSSTKPELRSTSNPA